MRAQLSLNQRGLGTPHFLASVYTVIRCLSLFNLFFRFWYDTFLMQFIVLLPHLSRSNHYAKRTYLRQDIACYRLHCIKPSCCSISLLFKFCIQTDMLHLARLRVYVTVQRSKRSETKNQQYWVLLLNK